MAEQVFAIHKQYGPTNRDDIIISKEFRDSHPLPAVAGTGAGRVIGTALKKRKMETA